LYEVRGDGFAKKACLKISDEDAFVGCIDCLQLNLNLEEVVARG
jgi:hypothetical protein